MTTELNEENFEESIKQGNAVLDFYADWCGPCQMMEPTLQKVSKEFKEVHFFKINVDENQQIASTYAVRSIPTIIFLKNGKEFDRIIGLLNEMEFRERVKVAFK